MIGIHTPPPEQVSGKEIMLVVNRQLEKQRVDMAFDEKDKKNFWNQGGVWLNRGIAEKDREVVDAMAMHTIQELKKKNQLEAFSFFGKEPRTGEPTLQELAAFAHNVMQQHFDKHDNEVPFPYKFHEAFTPGKKTTMRCSIYNNGFLAVFHVLQRKYAPSLTDKYALTYSAIGVAADITPVQDANDAVSLFPSLHSYSVLTTKSAQGTYAYTVLDPYWSRNETITPRDVQKMDYTSQRIPEGVATVTSSFELLTRFDDFKKNVFETAMQVPTPEWNLRLATILTYTLERNFWPKIHPSIPRTEMITKIEEVAGQIRLFRDALVLQTIDQFEEEISSESLVNIVHLEAVVGRSHFAFSKEILSRIEDKVRQKSQVTVSMSKVAQPVITLLSTAYNAKVDPREYDGDSDRLAIVEKIRLIFRTMLQRSTALRPAY